MDESVSGFTVRGRWGEIVEHGERVTRTLKDLADTHEIPEEMLSEWDEWRPKVAERLDQDVSKKTARQATIDEGGGEKAGKRPDEDVQTAGKKLSESYGHLDEPNRAVADAKASLGHLKRAVDSAGRKAFRRVEGAVYESVMTQVSPYYFDNAVVSANIRRVETDDYLFEVNVNDDDLKIRVSNGLADLEQTVERWHVDTEKDTAAVEAAEGVEDATEEAGTEGRSRPHTN